MTCKYKMGCQDGCCCCRCCCCRCCCGSCGNLLLHAASCTRQFCLHITSINFAGLICVLFEVGNFSGCCRRSLTSKSCSTASVRLCQLHYFFSICFFLQSFLFAFAFCFSFFVFCWYKLAVSGNCSNIMKNAFPMRGSAATAHRGRLSVSPASTHLKFLGLVRCSWHRGAWQGRWHLQPATANFCQAL